MDYISKCKSDGKFNSEKLKLLFPGAHIVSGTGNFGDKSASLQIMQNGKYSDIYRAIIGMSAPCVFHFKNGNEVYVADPKKLAALISLKLKCNEIKRGYTDYPDGRKVFNNSYFVCLKLSELKKISRIVPVYVGLV